MITKLLKDDQFNIHIRFAIDDAPSRGFTVDTRAVAEAARQAAREELHKQAAEQRATVNFTSHELIETEKTL